MDMRDLTKIACPACSYEFDADVVTVIRPNDQGLEELLNGQLNCFECESCEKSFHYESALLYKDDESAYYVFLNSFYAQIGWEEAEEEMKKQLNVLFADLDEEERPECRLTTNRNEFVEKIMIQQCELDDRMVEYLKYHIFNTEREYDPNRHQLLFDFSRTDEDNIEFTIFDLAEHKPVGNLRVSMAHYHKFEEIFEQENVTLDMAFGGYYISVEKLYKNQ